MVVIILKKSNDYQLLIFNSQLKKGVNQVEIKKD
jgi:hypothetical protein